MTKEITLEQLNLLIEDKNKIINEAFKRWQLFERERIFGHIEIYFMFLKPSIHKNHYLSYIETLKEEMKND